MLKRLGHFLLWKSFKEHYELKLQSSTEVQNPIIILNLILDVFLHHA